MNAHEPLLEPMVIAELRPTQMTVGFREVEEKRRRFGERGRHSEGHFLGRHMLPSVIGPKGRRYLIDNHHLAVALLREGVEAALVSTAADLSALSNGAFWIFLDNRGWCHPYDARGRRRDFDEIPASLKGLQDDPYRSLSGDLRHAGGYAKDLAPFAEFLWADFLRRRIKPKTIAKSYEAALRRALKLARETDAAFLPGWCGPDPIG
jgi:hypothetical protein